jgi:hypothetical protein
MLGNGVISFADSKCGGGIFGRSFWTRVSGIPKESV